MHFDPGALVRFDSSKNVFTLEIQYYALPFQFENLYRKRELLIQRDSLRGDSLLISTPTSPMNLENIFGSDLQKSGYLGRGITIGSNRDLTVNSGFRMQLNGKLAPDVHIIASLTDENTPIQPEGNTQTLQEIDKVFVQVNSPILSGTFGDFNLQFSGSEFGSLNRKVKGFRGAVSLEGFESEGAYASTRGRFHSVQFNGIDGVQGPYRLTGKNGEQHLVVIAGSERVYVNGMQMERGESNDYIIEYGNGEITFKSRRFITSYSRITIDFEYADRKYARDFFAARASQNFLSDALRISASFAREADDPDTPIDMTLTAEQKYILAQAGNDQTKASQDGVTYVGYDTASMRGAGSYSRQIDSTGSGSILYYQFNPGADSATYDVYFSYVGFGKGDYIKKSVGNFYYAGRNAGEYAPIRILAFPQLRHIGTLASHIQPVAGLSIVSEVAFSDFDQNRLSGIDDGANDDVAFHTACKLAPTRLLAGAMDLGVAEFQLRFRQTNRDFNPLERMNEIEFNRRWNLSQRDLASEIIKEAMFGYQPIQPVQLRGSFGKINRGLFSSERIEGSAAVLGDSIPTLHYAIEAITSEDMRETVRASWIRQRGDLEYTYSLFTPFVKFEEEKKQSRSGAVDTLNEDSFSFLDIQSGIRLQEFYHMTLSASVGKRDENNFSRGSLRPVSSSLLQQYNWRLREWNSISSSVNVIIRDKKYSDEFLSSGNKDFQNILTKIQLRVSPFNRGIDADAYYEVSTERTAKLEALFLPRPLGLGDRKYVSDRNNNGIVDDSDFDPALYGDGDWIKILVPGDQLFPVLDLKSSVRFRLTPARWMTSTDGFFHSTMKILSTETFLRIEEKSTREPTSDIYFLRLSHFLNDSTTLRGLQTLTQDVFVFENDPTVSFRLRFDERRSFSQFALQNETGYRREYSFRSRTRFIDEIGFQIDYARTQDNLDVSAQSTRARNISSDVFSFDLSYRPQRNIEIGFIVGLKSSVDDYPVIPITAELNIQTIRANFSFAGQGRARIEFERAEALLRNATTYFPYELTDGRTEGQNWVLRCNADYRVTNFLQATLSYLGRFEGTRAAIHTARAEVKTYF